MAPAPVVQHSNLTRENLLKKSSALWRQRLDYYFSQVCFCGLRRRPVAACSAGALQDWTKGADFTLTDSNNKPVTLAKLLAEPINNKPPRGVLLIFYRGYW